MKGASYKQNSGKIEGECSAPWRHRTEEIFSSYTYNYMPDDACRFSDLDVIDAPTAHVLVGAPGVPRGSGRRREEWGREGKGG